MKIVLASSNPGKIQEFNLLLKKHDINVIPQTELGVEDAPETGLSFIENAILKARHASKITGLPAIADDSGLAVTALGGAPGIYSARYAGDEANSQNNIQKLLSALTDVPDEHRGAWFHCVLVYLSSANDPVPLVCNGQWEGTILHAPRGERGFGYDPVFYVPSEKQSAAELTPAIKNTISHRACALAELISKLPAKLRMQDH